MADDLAMDKAIADAIALLNYYGFDLTGQNADLVLEGWQQQYPAPWLRTAVLEALYRGRYKQISVEDILRSWHKRGEIHHNFDGEFEALICSKLEDSATIKPVSTDAETPQPISEPHLEIAAFQPTPVVPETYQKLKAIAADDTAMATDDEQS